MKRTSLHYALVLTVLAWYLGVSLWKLDVVPPVYEDEPWQASTGWHIATDGVFASDVFAGFHRMEERYYGYMPVHPYALAVTFRLFGLGLYQARVETVAMGLFTLVLTYLLARRLAGRSTALLAVALLVFVRLSGTTPDRPTGIVLLDVARIARYDMVVPVAGLAALHVFLFASERRQAALFALTGLLTALAGLSHLYGNFWLLTFALLAARDRVGGRNLLALAAGFALPWIAYATYVLQDIEAWRGQTSAYGPRFDLLNWRFYWDNLLREPTRYGQGLLSEGWTGVFSPGVLAATATLAATLPWLARRSMRGDRIAFVIVAPLVVFPGLFALLVHMKLINYTVVFLPIAAVAAAWALVAFWRGAEAPRRRWIRPALAAVLGVVMIEGGYRAARLAAIASVSTPYPALAARLHAAVPPGSRVLGLHHYWLGFQDTAYRSWLVPWIQTMETYWSPPRSMEEALESVDPQFVIIDPRMREALLQSPERGRAVHRWMDRRGFELVDEFEDHTYGRFELYRAGTAHDRQ